MQGYETYTAYRKDLETGKDRCVDVVRSFLQKIEDKRPLNIFLEVYHAEAIERAADIDARLAEGRAGRLAGMVIGLKDNICYAGHKVSASSRILEGFESLYSSTAVERLLAEDAIIIGRLNCDEFAMGSSNENSAYGPVHNPLDETKAPGGSSGGSAAAVAAGLCHAALGSDTGGSIRQPASFCGVVGFRPTYGRISRHGLLAFASSMDQIGPVTTNIEDCALLTEIMAGPDDFDGTASQKPAPAYTEGLSANANYKLAYLQDCIQHQGVDMEIREWFAQFQKDMEALGNASQDADFPFLDYALPVYYILATAEASSNLGRYAGMTYGHRTKEAGNLDTLIIRSRSEGFGEEVKRRIMLGTFVLSEGYYDAYYGKAQKVRRLIQQHAEELLENNDFIILPTSPGTAFAIGENVEDPISMYLADIFTIQSALAGLPSISLPLGWHSNGMPFGLQITGRSFDEERLLAFSNYLMTNYSNRPV